METTDFLDPVDDNFLCSICHNVMVSPCTCSQGHQFCRDCISTWLQRSPTCPSRCGGLTADSLIKQRIAENLINKLQVRCCHAGVTDGPSPGPKNLRRRSRANLASSEADSEKGCGWKGPLEARARHLRDECLYLEVECSCEGCDAMVRRSQLSEHQAHCEYREVSCAKCEKMATVREMGDHLLGCHMVEIPCPQECGARVLRRDVGEHEKECANVVVGCSFAVHGCEVRGKRKKIEEHEEEAAVAHARLAARRAGRELERNAALEKEVSELKQALGEKSGALAAKTSQVAKLEKELEESKRQLVSVLQVAGQATREERVTWKIEGFTAKALAKEPILSNVFHVQTNAGFYHLQLMVNFWRNHGSMTHGAMGLFLKSSRANGGSANYPVGVGGTTLTVEKGGTKRGSKFPGGTVLEYGKSWGYRDFLTPDKIPGLEWTQADRQLPRDYNERPRDVTDFLENDTLTVTGDIRVTPSKKCAITI